MAIMYPPVLERKDPPIPSSEQRVYEALRDQLDAGFSVFYSAAWLARGAKNQLRDGEGDFVILHSQYGMLVIEVKGGRIRFDATRPNSQQWQTIDRYDTIHNLKQSPFEQAKQTKYTLKAKIFDLPHWQNETIIFGHAVIFPDVAADFTVLPTDVDAAILIDGRDLGNLAQRILGIYQSWRGSQLSRALTPKEHSQIVQLLAPVGELKPRLNTRIGKDQAEIITLTKQQYQVLDILRRQRQTLIAGCAGSGKTMLALEKATRLASNEGMRVLLLCYNKRLGNELKIHTNTISNLYANHFHQFCIDMCKQAGFAVEQPKSLDLATYFADFLPEQLLLASEHLKTMRFDALIVDEGQDFRSNWWDCLQEFLVDNPIMYIFYDDNQNIYTDDYTFPITHEPCMLDVNCRNTQQIHHAISYFYRSSDPRRLNVQGPEGEKIDVRFFADANEERTLLHEILTSLRVEQHVAARDITILTRYTPERLGLTNTTIGGFVLNDPPRTNQVLCCTIQSYKGLETPVVVMTGLGDVVEGEQPDLEILLYIGCSRATSHLIVLLPKTTSHKLRKAFQQLSRG